MTSSRMNSKFKILHYEFKILHYEEEIYKEDGTL